MKSNTNESKQKTTEVISTEKVKQKSSRPRSGYNFFVAEMAQKDKQDKSFKFGESTKEYAKKWGSLAETEKEKFKKLAQDDKNKFSKLSLLNKLISENLNN